MNFPSFYQHFLREGVISVELLSDIMAKAKEEHTRDAPTHKFKEFDNYDKIHKIKQDSVSNKVKNKTTSGPDLDHIMWYKPSYRERVKAETATRVSKFNFRFIYIDISASEISRVFDTTNLYRALKILESVIGKQPNVITFAFNTSAHETPEDFMRLGADKGGVFMIGHKLGHSARTAHNLFDHTYEISSDLSRIEYIIQDFMKSQSTSEYIGTIPLKFFSNLKSVQSGRIISSMEEFVYDLFGQYLKFGRVTFRPMHDSVQHLANKLTAMSEQVTGIIEKILTQMVGQVVFDVV